MTVEMLNKGTILVLMEGDDMRRYSLSFEEGSAPEQGLKKLLYRIGEECGIDSRGKSFLVEALPSRGGCLLIISVRRVRKVYRIKRDSTRTLCVFDTADMLLDRLLLGGELAGTVYSYREKYILIPALSATKRSLALLSEYGRLVKADAVETARIREFGSKIDIPQSLRGSKGAVAVPQSSAPSSLIN